MKEFSWANIYSGEEEKKESVEERKKGRTKRMSQTLTGIHKKSSKKKKEREEGNAINRYGMEI